MRHGSTLALVASCLLAATPGLARAGSGPGHEAGWILPESSRGVRVAPILLLSRPEVQAELHMKPEQVADANGVIADAYHKASLLRGRTGQDVVEQRRAVDEEQRVWLETKLTEDQVGRLTEIDLQWEGVAAIATRTGVGEALALSSGQKAIVVRALADLRKHQSRPAERERDPAAAERHFTQQVWANLNDGQRRRWEKMLGRPITLMATAPPTLGSNP